MLELCPPVVEPSQYTCLRQGLVYENDKDRHIFRHSILCWSVKSTLPKWVQLSSKMTEVVPFKYEPILNFFNISTYQNDVAVSTDHTAANCG